ncbi:MAG: type II toxin-antitoxin system RelE/ParE family toxin [Desulfuromonadales bacterium]|nr:type II toxin-antitoxin system RelE/ParE family toxin [Desulfuromonadales bacterium]
MNNDQIIISPAARDDLRDIYHFGLRNWGQNRSAKYLEEIKESLWALCKQPHIGCERPELLPGMRSFAVASHVAFYLVQSQRIEIIRVLHSRQDPSRHLSSG